jgi:hypothetical protein
MSAAARKKVCSDEDTLVSEAQEHPIVLAPIICCQKADYSRLRADIFAQCGAQSTNGGQPSLPHPSENTRALA